MEGNRKVTCGDCPWDGTEGQAGTLHQIHRLAERLEPGSVVPVGECPECGALAYLMEPETVTITWKLEDIQDHARDNLDIELTDAEAEQLLGVASKALKDRSAQIGEEVIDAVVNAAAVESVRAAALVAVNVPPAAQPSDSAAG